MAIEFIVVNPGVIWESDSMTITAFPVTHRGPGVLGFAFEEASRRPFLAEEAARLGVPNGPERRHLVEGRPITLADGAVVRPEQVLGEEVRGTKFVHVGDAGRIDDLVAPCRDADALVIEATYASDEADMAARFGHLTARQAAELAVAASVKNLFLVHISRRYSPREIAREAREVFPNTIVPKDLDHYRISKEGIEKVGEGDGR